MNAITTTAPVTFQEVQTMASAVAKSGLFGVKTPDQALSLLLLAQAEGLHPMIAARDYDIIKGKPSKKSEAMMRSFLENNGTVEWIELTDTVAKAKFSHPKGGTVTIDWDMNRASKANLLGRDGDMYKKYPRRMLSARCISEGIRTVCPSATSGMYTPEEVRDIAEEPITVSDAPVKETGKPSRLEGIVDAQIEKLDPSVVTEEIDPTPEANMVEGIIDDLKMKGDRYGGGINGVIYGTPDINIYEKMLESHDRKKKCRILWENIAGRKEALDVLVYDEPVTDNRPI